MDGRKFILPFEATRISFFLLNCWWYHRSKTKLEFPQGAKRIRLRVSLLRQLPFLACRPGAVVTFYDKQFGNTPSQFGLRSSNVRHLILETRTKRGKDISGERYGKNVYVIIYSINRSIACLFLFSVFCWKSVSSTLLCGSYRPRCMSARYISHQPFYFLGKPQDDLYSSQLTPGISQASLW